MIIKVPLISLDVGSSQRSGRQYSLVNAKLPVGPRLWYFLAYLAPSFSRAPWRIQTWICCSFCCQRASHDLWHLCVLQCSVSSCNLINLWNRFSSLCYKWKNWDLESTSFKVSEVMNGGLRTRRQLSRCLSGDLIEGAASLYLHGESHWVTSLTE